MAHRVAHGVAQGLVFGATLLSGCTDSGVKPGVDPFCTTRPQLPFCEDFDQAELPGRFVERLEQSATLRLDEDRADAPSAPRALVAELDGDGAARAQLTAPLAAGRKIRGFVQLHVDGQGGGEVELMRLGLGTSTVSIHATAQGAYPIVIDGVSTPAKAALVVGEWSSVRINADLDGLGGGRVTVFFGMDEAISDAPLVVPAGTPPALTIGAAADSGARGWRVAYDNVTFSTEDPAK